MNFLTSCGIVRDYSFSGCNRIDQKNHWIALQALKVAKYKNEKWYTMGGPGTAGGNICVNCFLFKVGLPSDKEPPPLEIIRLDIFYNNHSHLKYTRLQNALESQMMGPWYSPTRYEIWIPSQHFFSGSVSEIPEGTYRIKVHYRLGDEVYDAEWHCVYKTKAKIERWQPVISKVKSSQQT